MKKIFNSTSRFQLYLLSAALVLLFVALTVKQFLMPTTSATYYSALIEKDIQNKESLFRNLAGNSALLQKLIDQTYVAEELNPILEQNAGFGFFIYEERSFAEPHLLFWNTQQAVPPMNFMGESDVSRLVTLKNGVYIHSSKRITLGQRKLNVEALIPVLYKYFVEIENLKTEFAAFPKARNAVELSLNPTSYPVRSSFGNLLFYLQPRETGQQTNSIWFLVLVGVALFLLFWNIHQTAHQIALSKGVLWGWFFLIVIVSLFRALIYYFPDILYLRQYELFDPAIYSSSFLLGSLGDLFINALLFCWFALFINRRMDRLATVSFKAEWKNWTVSSMAIGILVLLTFLFARVLQSLVADAQISFNVTNLDSVSLYSFVGFVIFASLALTYFLMAQVLLKIAGPVMQRLPFLKYIIASVLGLLILTFTSNTAVVELNLFVLIWLMVFIWLMHQEYFSGLEFRLNVSEVLFWLFVFSFSISAVIVSENRKIEFEQRKRFAEKLSQQADPYNERLLSIALTYLDNDFLAPNLERFRDKATNARLKDSIINKNFSAYINKFDTRLYVFEGNATNPVPLFNDDPVSFDTLNTIFKVQGKPTNINDLHYFERAFDEYAYIWKKEVKGADSTVMGYFFIIADPKKYKKDALIPELFRQNREMMLPEYSSLYSYAVYNEGELIDYFNEYPFATHLSADKVPRQEFLEIRNGSYVELWYRYSPDKIVVVTKKNNSFIEAITLFAYLFSTFLLLLGIYWLVSLLIRSRFRWKELRSQWQFSIKTQIHSTIILVSVLSFIVIGAATIVFFINRYNRNNQERLSRTMQIMVKQVENRIKGHDIFNDGISIIDSGVNNDLEQLVADISDIHGTDINMYDPSGNLKVASKPLIYDKEVLSRKMNPSAYFKLHVLHSIQCVENEQVGKVQYLSVYNPVRDDEGHVIAYLNVPSYSSQGELKQEISNFLVTLINLNAFIFLVAGAIALFISNRITHSFTLIGQKMRAIKLGQKNQEITWSRNDEIGELVDEYNKMVHQLNESAQALAKSEREGAWRQMARQVAHEIKNPLTPMKLSIQYLQKAIDNNSPNVKEMTQNVARTLVEQIDHLSKIASDFSQFANIGNPRKEVFDIHELVHSISLLYEATENLEYKWEPVNQRVMVFADKTQMNRLFTNLLQNAIEAASGRAEKSIHIIEQLEADHILFRIIDNGEGIPEHTRSRIFTPNFTTKSSGTGLGLAMSKSIVENAQGEIWFETEEGVGTTFFVKLPLLRVS